MIIDYIDKLEFTADNEDYLFDAQMTLARLSQGLFWLYNSVVQAEGFVREKAAKDNSSIVFEDWVINNVHSDWLSCAFQWYTVSAYNYVRLVGWLATKDPGFTSLYVQRVIPKVTNYRHKVAAHFAITDPRNDNEADLISSINTNIIYAYGYLRAGAMSEIITDEKGNDLEVSKTISWSLTKTHDALIPRFWPNGPLKAFQSFQISPGSKRKFKFDWED